jgi:predicted AAA+ superfamily ATPase
VREEDFATVLSEWKNARIPELIQREVKIPLDSNMIVSIIGPRQAGKTFRVYQMVKELLDKVPYQNIVYVNFEHERMRNLDAVHLEEMLKVYYQLYKPDKAYPIYLLLDEIQNVKDWDRWVRRVNDEGRYRIYITGSSSKLSSREIATSLRGRSISYTVFPFSFREFLRAKKFEIKDVNSLVYLEERGSVYSLLEEFVSLGGYPKVVLTEDIELKKKILRSYYEAVFYKDLIDRYRVNSSLLDTFLRYCISNYSSMLSVSKVYAYMKSLGLKCSKSTLMNYFRYSEEVFFLFPIEIFSYSIKDRKIYPRKIYIIDTGLIKCFYPEEEIGRLIENTVAIELLRKTQEDTSFGLFYWKEYGKRNGREVDFVISKGNRPVELIQVTYSYSKEQIENREIESLIKASEELNCKNMKIITWDYYGSLDTEKGKIQCLPLWFWLIKS